MQYLPLAIHCCGPRRLEPLEFAQSRYPGRPLVPVIWDRRLYLIWPIFKEQSERPKSAAVPTPPSGGTAETGAEILGGRVRDERVQRRPVAAETGARREDVLHQDELRRGAPRFLPRPSHSGPSRDRHSTCRSMPTGTWASNRPTSRRGDRQSCHARGTDVRGAGFRPVASRAGAGGSRQEPSYALITTGSLTGNPDRRPHPTAIRDRTLSTASIPANPGTVALDVLAQSTSSGQLVNEVLLEHHRQSAPRRPAAGSRLRQHGSRSSSRIPSAATWSSRTTTRCRARRRNSTT